VAVILDWVGLPGFAVMFINSFMDDIGYVRNVEVCRVWFVVYQSASAMALRILDWDLCVITMLDLLAQPYSSIP